MRSMLQLLQTKVLRWTVENGEQRLIVARAKMQAAELPPGAVLSPREVQGRRVILKDRRKHRNQRIHIADWPASNLHEIALPKLACVVSGSADYLLGEYSVRCHEGTFILIPPRMPHQRRGPFLEESHQASGACTLLFAYAYSHGIYLWSSRSRGARHSNDMADNYLIPNVSAVQVFNLLMEEAVAGAESFEFICHNLLGVFFTLLAREIGSGHYMHPGPKASHEILPAPASGFAGQIQEYLDANLHKPLRLGEVAAQMYMSGSQFSRRLRQETGTTFIELLMRARVARAQELLRETDWTANAIAGYVGFKSSTYFQELFRRRVGCTPIEYRQRANAAKNDEIPISVTK